MLSDAELTALSSRISRPEEAGEILAALDKAAADKRLAPERARELRSFVILKTAELLAAAPNRDWLAAIAWLESSIARYGSDPRLEQEIRNFSSNRAADFHNRFAAAYNKRNYDEAEAILREGLAEFPGNRQLQNDRTAVERAAGTRR
jgi:hypothetical protein